MGRIAGFVVGVPLALLAVCFALANRHAVRLEFWPLPFALDVDVYLIVLAPLALGLLMGGVLGRLSGLGARRGGGVS